MRDVASPVDAVQSIAPLLRNSSDTNGSSADLQNFDGALLVAEVGTEGDTLSASVKIEFEVEESDDNSAWTDVADADLVNAVTGTNPGTFAVVDANAEAPATYVGAYVGKKRYIRIVENRTGTHTVGTTTGASILRMLPRNAT